MTDPGRLPYDPLRHGSVFARARVQVLVPIPERLRPAKKLRDRPLVTRDAQTLLLVAHEDRSVEDPDDGAWELPWGWNEGDETSEETARRILFVQHGLLGERLTLVHTSEDVAEGREGASPLLTMMVDKLLGEPRAFPGVRAVWGTDARLLGESVGHGLRILLNAGFMRQRFGWIVTTCPDGPSRPPATTP